VINLTVEKSSPHHAKCQNTKLHNDTMTTALQTSPITQPAGDINRKFPI